MSESTAVMIPEPVSVPGMRQEQFDKQTAFRDQLERNLPQIMATLPKGVRAEVMTSVAMTAALDNPALLDCSPLSMFRAVLKMASLGLRHGETCDLVPISGKAECWVRTKGVVELAMRAGSIQWAREGFVCQGDEFEYEERTEGTHFRHRPVATPRADASNVTHVYAIVTLPNKTRIYEVWTKARVDEHKARNAKGKDGGAVWQKHPLPMMAKTVVKAAMRFASLSPEVRSAMAAGDEVPDGSFEVMPTAADPSAALAAVSGSLAALERMDSDAADPAPIVQGDPPTPKQLELLQRMLKSHVFTDKERRAVEVRVTSKQKAADAIDWATKTIKERKAAEAAADDADVEALDGSEPFETAA